MRRGLVVALLAAASVALPHAARADGIVATCTASGVTAPCSTSWYRSDVTVSFILPGGSSNPQGCGDQTIATDTAGTTITCTVAVSGTQCCRLDVTIRRDATPPDVTAVTAARPPDANGWYNHPVSFAVSGSDATSGIASCATVSYGGPDSASASVEATCTDNAGNVSAAQRVSFQYDSTAPTVTGATPDRAADANGWSNHRVVVTLAGSDATSGIASCDAPAYAGPTSATASVTGQCRDKAGNTSAPFTYALKYDSTPPTLTDLAATPLGNGAALTWRASSDTASITIARSVAGTSSTRLYSGKPRSAFTDGKLRNGVRYRFTVTAADAAGNAVTRTILVRPSSPLLAPRTSAHVHGAPRLKWRPVAKATYYNVQLWRRGVKVLSAWPHRANFRVRSTWTYLGRTYRLQPGTYTWYVWPGFGSLAKHRFGSLVGRSSFVVAP